MFEHDFNAPLDPFKPPPFIQLQNFFLWPLVARAQ
jgi:hypothetical protein